MDHATLMHLLMFLAGVAAGFTDAIAGGGGLIALPVLLAAGVPPHQALATNKLQASFGTFTAALNYTRAGLMPTGHLLLGIAATAAGALSGALLVRQLAADFLRPLIIAMLALMFLYMLFAPQARLEGGARRLSPTLFYPLAGLALRFYDGFFGPGTGSFWILALLALAGLGLKRATAQAKVFNFTSNVAALALFAASGLVVWSYGLLMGAGQVVGALAGSTLVQRRQARFIRLFFLLAVGATILRLLWTELSAAPS
jgi:uncharacterized membrane protein YfcA